MDYLPSIIPPGRLFSHPLGAFHGRSDMFPGSSATEAHPHTLINPAKATANKIQRGWMERKNFTVKE